MRVKQANLSSPRTRHEGDAPAQGSTTDHGNRAAGDLFLCGNAHSSVLSRSFPALRESGFPWGHSYRQTRKYTRGRTVRLRPCPTRSGGGERPWCQMITCSAETALDGAQRITDLYCQCL